MRKEKGITLVALVVTIIVLIILAGISINLVLGDNGIITIAKKAKENTELAKIQEETELNELYTQLETEGSSSGNLPYDSIAKLTEFKTAIANAIGEAGGVKPDISAETTVFANNIKGIVKEVTKNATATASDISSGKTAWVDGKLITGTNKKDIRNNAIVFTTSPVKMSDYIEEWSSLTIEDFKVGCTSINASASGGDNTVEMGNWCGPTMTYDASTGTLTFKNGSGKHNNGDHHLKYSTSGAFVVYLGSIGGTFKE